MPPPQSQNFLSLFSLSTILLLLPLLPNTTHAWSSVPQRTLFPTRTSTTSTTTTLQSTASSPSTTNNIVFRPSETPEAFDSYQIGSPRIHRYGSSRQSEASTEYVMWYHGRSISSSSSEGGEEEEAAALPPLSTGRIGRATSLNGLHWIRDETGSADSDYPGTTLGTNTEEWWGFDTAHVGLGQVMLPISTPAVITEGGVYLMYYMGGNWDEMEVAEFMQGGDDGGGAKVSGMKMKIGVALSQDGITFGRVEGDDPSGACMFPYDPKDQSQDWIGETTGRDNEFVLEEELYCAWPDVVVAESNVGFFMYYSTCLKETKEKAICVAVSRDGFRWFKRGVCVRSGAEGRLDDAGCARSTVVRNARFDEKTMEWIEENGWTMFYEGISKADGKHRILAATSSDGRTWSEGELVLDVGNEGDWDEDGVGSPHLVRLDDGSVRMYYVGRGKELGTAVGVAKCESGEMRGGEFSFVRENVNINLG